MADTIQIDPRAAGQDPRKRLEKARRALLRQHGIVDPQDAAEQEAAEREAARRARLAEMERDRVPLLERAAYMTNAELEEAGERFGDKVSGRLPEDAPLLSGIPAAKPPSRIPALEAKKGELYDKLGPLLKSPIVNAKQIAAIKQGLADIDKAIEQVRVWE